ncbi:MAG: radical SAM protein [Bacteroidia bacterium]|nr:radical SAM protein [Bacteroidia bacterium]
MFDRYNRKISYLRISITDKCNLWCRYCKPEEKCKLLRHDEILTYEEITEFVKVAVKLGIEKIRITGGEPLVRKGVTGLIRMISAIPGINDLSMTTNGIILEQFANALFDAGLHRVNVSLDTVNPEKYAIITRGGNINKVFNGIKAAQKAGLNPVKINCVVQCSSNESDAVEVKNFCKANGLIVRFIRQMDLQNGDYSVVEGGEGGNCAICNRIRLTASGLVKPCLFSDMAYNIREIGIEKAIRSAVEAKPEKGSFCFSNRFYNIGG